MAFKTFPPSGGKSWSIAATGSLSGTSTVISGLSGERLLLTIDNGGFGGFSNSFALRLNGDTGSNYLRGSTASVKSTSINLNGSNTDSTNFIAITIDQADSASPVKVLSMPGTSVGFGGLYYSTSVITSITIFPGGSANNMSGTYTVWKYS